MSGEHGDWLGDFMRRRYRATNESDVDADELEPESKHVDLDAGARSNPPSRPASMDELIREAYADSRVSHRWSS
jgi:hypothetical protein